MPLITDIVLKEHSLENKKGYSLIKTNNFWN